MRSASSLRTAFTLTRSCGAAMGVALVLAGCGDSSGVPETTGVDTEAVSIRHGVDYSWYRPSPASLQAQGYTFAARYLSHDTTGKNLSKAEADALIAAGIDVVSNWEDSATDALSGYGQGVSDAQAAEAQAAADGAPSTRPIYFSVDFDATPGQQTAIDAYFDGVASVIGVSRTGAYGGYYVIQRLFNAGKIKWGWQTYAWSGGQWDARAQLRQIQNGIAGGQMDEDESVADDFGEWGATPPPPPPDRPRGYLDDATCAVVAGWAQDPQVATAPIFADVYYDAPAGGAGAQGIRLTADVWRKDLCTAIGSCDHAFSMPTPRGVMDGHAHPVYAYGINHTAGGLDALLTNSPKSVTCAPPAIPAGRVKRHVVNPTVLADWRFDTFLDMATYTAAAIAAVPTGADLGSAPRVVQAKGDPAVYVADGTYRRHIVDPASLAAWRLTAADVKPITAADLAALTAGPDWPQVPLLAKDPTDPAVYMLDEPYPASPDGGVAAGDGGIGTSDDGGAGTSGDDGGAGDGASPGSSSGCTAASGHGSPGWAWLFFVPCALVIGRRMRKTCARTEEIRVPQPPASAFSMSPQKANASSR